MAYVTLIYLCMYTNIANIFVIFQKNKKIRDSCLWHYTEHMVKGYTAWS